MKFFINNRECNEIQVEPDLSLLRYIREKLSLTGTKEGCASGDCGACTVLVINLEDDELHYQTINSCITPTLAIAGKQIITVEHLAKDDTLHPAQSSMVKCHGSQCGFCTPGFIMSLACLYERSKNKDKKITRSDVCESISGNLCRCTGYRPIVNAGLAMDLKEHSKIHDQKDQFKKRLANIVEPPIKNENQPVQIAAIDMPCYLRPTNESFLQRYLQMKPKAKLIAGGTDLMLEVTQSHKEIDHFIDLTQVAELQEIMIEKDQIKIGAAVSYSKLENFFKPLNDSLYFLFERIASQQIRNRGTIGGNIANASPIADLPPALLALNASLTLKNTQGDSRVVHVNDFYTGYKQTALKQNEYIASIVIDENAFSDFSRFLKVSKRIEDDISTVMLAVRFKIQDTLITKAYIAYGGVAAIPLRVTEAEQPFKNKRIDDKSAIEKAISIIKKTLCPLSDVRASAKYRLDIAESLIYKAWLELNGKATPLLSKSSFSIELSSKNNEKNPESGSKGNSSHA